MRDRDAQSSFDLRYGGRNGADYRPTKRVQQWRYYKCHYCIPDEIQRIRKSANRIDQARDRIPAIDQFHADDIRVAEHFRVRGGPVLRGSVKRKLLIAHTELGGLARV
jgi:hypothetical protein